jgi:hypothetical protein
MKPAPALAKTASGKRGRFKPLRALTPECCSNLNIRARGPVGSPLSSWGGINPPPYFIGESIVGRNANAAIKYIVVIFAVIAFASCSENDPPTVIPPVEPYPAASSNYRIESFEGITLEVPAHWVKLDSDTRRNLAIAGEQIFSVSPYGGGEEQDKSTVLAMNSTPSPHGAMIRVSRNNSIPEITSDAIFHASRSDIDAMSAEFATMFGSVMPEFVSMLGVEKVAISGRWALKISYLRKDLRNGQDDWQVDQYLIPSDGQSVWQVTLSRRVSDRILWDPILDRVKSTIRL